MASRLVLGAVLAAVTAGLLVFSLTLAFFGDEAIHLLAGSLINAGKRPYLDFFYQHVPLYAYLIAGVLRLFGGTWRAVHVVSALCTAAAVLLATRFVWTRVREPDWRLGGALTVVLLMGLHAEVVRFGTIGQAYGVCLFLIVAAFCLTTTAVRREDRWPAFGAGLCAGAASASSLLAAPAGPLLLFWMHRHALRGPRLRRAAWFVTGAVIPFGPLLWLAVQAPRETLFNVVEYHLLYRRSGLSVTDTLWSDLKTLHNYWLESPQALILALLAIVGLLSLRGGGDWDAQIRAEFAFCGWMAAGLGVFGASTMPTFPQYLVLLVPFLSILASLGLYAIGTRIGPPGRTAWLPVLVAGVFAVGLVKPMHESLTDVLRWPYFDEVAREVNLVTPVDGLIWADDWIYVAARRHPPPGMENAFARELPLSPEVVASLRAVPFSESDKWLAAGRFSTVVLYSINPLDDPRVGEYRLAERYAQRKRVGQHEIFWGIRQTPAPAALSRQGSTGPQR